MRAILLGAGEGPEAAARCAALAAQSGSQFPLHLPHAVSLALGIPGLNTSQRQAIVAGLTRRLTLVQVRSMTAGEDGLPIYHAAVSAPPLAGPPRVRQDDDSLRARQGVAALGPLAHPRDSRLEHGRRQPRRGAAQGGRARRAVRGGPPALPPSAAAAPPPPPRRPQRRPLRANPARAAPPEPRSPRAAGLAALRGRAPAAGGHPLRAGRLRDRVRGG